MLTGGGGADIFRYLAWTDSTSSAPDSITDFQIGVDKIDLSAVSPTSITMTQTSGAYLFNAVTALGTMVISSTQAIMLSDIITGSSGLSLTGTAGNDLLTGTANNDFLYGLGDDDTLIGGPGADYLDGGSDTVSYVTARSGLYVDLARPANNTGDAAGDTYVSIENLTGTGFADVLRGDTGSNVLRGGGGRRHAVWWRRRRYLRSGQYVQSRDDPRFPARRRQDRLGSRRVRPDQRWKSGVARSQPGHRLGRDSGGQDSALRSLYRAHFL